MVNFKLFEEFLNKELVVSNEIVAICDKYEGMCESQTLAAVNFATSNCLVPGEQFLEIGCWKGRLTVGSLYNNTVRSTVIDTLNCDDSDVVFYQNIKDAGVADRVDMNQMSWEDYMMRGLRPQQPIGALFYDGHHSAESTYGAWEQFLPYCADEVLLFADDFAMPPVEEGVNKFIKDYSDNIVFYHVLPYWMKQAVIGFKK
jgi:hypothetical protein